MWVLWDCVVDENIRKGHTQWDHPCFKIYAGIWGVVLLVWLQGCTVFVWNRYRINYRYILELTDRTPQPVEIISSASTITLVFLVNFLLFYKSQRASQGDLPLWAGGAISRSIPLVMLLYLMFCAVVPWSERRASWVTVLHILRAPFCRVRFRDFYAGDLWTSLVKPSVNIAFGICYYASGSFITESDVCNSTTGLMRWVGPVLSALPLWCRFMQCLRRFHDTRQRFPHLANAGKYAISHTVVILSLFATTSNYTDGYQGVWLTSLVMSSLTTFYWDVKMDWGLGSRTLKPDIFNLRPRLMFQRKWIYYTAIFADLVMRFLWTLTLISFAKETPVGYALSNFLQPILTSVELARRTMWACLRLETEHLVNTEGFRTVDVIPLHFARATRNPTTENNETSLRTKVEVTLFGLLIVGFAAAALIGGMSLA
eukprot:c6459_g1_i1.p1 GENE.c6459_g1_i1~~c6459_g1_i1.p1  ORF type:complete len:428 (-),score=73.46 c6459_g1_i1:175-1458(-)